LHSHLDTLKSAKHEGVNRQRRHGVMRPLDGLGNGSQRRHCFEKRQFNSCFTLYRTILRYRQEELKKKLFQLSFVITVFLLVV
jgi:hypothetical protein